MWMMVPAIDFSHMFETQVLLGGRGYFYSPSNVFHTADPLLAISNLSTRPCQSLLVLKFLIAFPLADFSYEAELSPSFSFQGGSICGDFP